MEIECPNCFYEQCYWENRHYVCPDCGYEWPDDMIYDDDEEEDDDYLSET